VDNATFKPFKISISPSALSERAIERTPYGWRETEVSSFESIRKIAVSFPYSSSFFRKEKDLGMVERKGEIVRDTQRNERNVLGMAPLAIFDVDSGLSVKEACEILDKKNLEYMMLTTRSHGTEKAAGMDRFRIFLPLKFDKIEKYNYEGISLPENTKLRNLNIKELKYLQSEIARELEILDDVDPSPLYDMARKYVPSPSDALTIIKNTGNRFDITNAGRAALKRVESDIKENARKKKIAHDARIKFTSYEAMKECSYKQYVDIGALCSLDLAEVMMHYESEEEETRYYTEGTYTYVHNKTHKYSIIFNESSGEYVYHDFKGTGKGNIITYMKEYLQEDSLFKIARQLKDDFSKELIGVHLIKTNPAYYLEPLRKKLEDNTTKPLEKLKKDYLKEMDIKDIIFNKDFTKCTVVENKGWKNTFKLDSGISETIKTLLKENLNIKKNEVELAVGDEELSNNSIKYK